MTKIYKGKKQGEMTIQRLEDWAKSLEIEFKKNYYQFLVLVPKIQVMCQKKIRE